MQLYPSANIFVAIKKDFEPKKRKKFCGRIETGDYDAVIIDHINEIIDGIAELKENRGDKFSIH